MIVQFANFNIDQIHKNFSHSQISFHNEENTHFSTLLLFVLFGETICTALPPIPVVIEGIKDSQPLDADTVLWNKDKCAIGKVKCIVYFTYTCILGFEVGASQPAETCM